MAWQWFEHDPNTYATTWHGQFMNKHAQSAGDTRCVWLDPANHHNDTPHNSCGLDLWQSSTGLAWSNHFLHAESALLMVEANNERASLSCQLRHLPGGFRLASTYPYGRIEGSIKAFRQSIPAISKALRKKNILRLEIPFTGPYTYQLNALTTTRSVHIPRSLEAVRHVLDMSAPTIDDLDKRFDANARWAMRKAIRNGCSVRLAKPNDIDTLQDLYARTMCAKGAPVHYDRKRFAGIVEELAPQHHGSLYIGEIDGEPHGMAAVVDGSVSRHLIQLAVPPDAHGSRLGELLVGTAIHDAHRQGLHYFDFMASSASDHGLQAFKSKWGTSAEPIRHVVIAGLPGLHRMVDIGRWAIRVKAHIRAA